MIKNVLDHGFVKLRNIAGPTRRSDQLFDAHDIDPAQSARMSFNQMGSDRTLEEDYRLSRYLMKNWHNTPFEMVVVWLEMKLPIFVARQFVRHRTVSINEISGRYVTLPAEWYIPDVVGAKAPNAKQGQSDTLPKNAQDAFKEVLNKQCAESYRCYIQSLDVGIAPEHARLFLHVNHYTHWLWKQDLHNLFNFLRLRDDEHAQIEAQLYARAIGELIRSVLPHSYSLYEEYRRG